MCMWYIIITSLEIFFFYVSTAQHNRKIIFSLHSDHIIIMSLCVEKCMLFMIKKNSIKKPIIGKVKKFFSLLFRWDPKEGSMNSRKFSDNNEKNLFLTQTFTTASDCLYIGLLGRISIFFFLFVLSLVSCHELQH